MVIHLMTPGKLYVVDYDIPADADNRRTFYRRLHIILAAHGLVVERSTQSVWILDNREIAQAIHALALNYGSSNIYEATKID